MLSQFKIAKAMDEKGLTARKLAESLGLCHNTVYAFMAGRNVSVKNALLIADALDKTIDELREDKK